MKICDVGDLKKHNNKHTSRQDYVRWMITYITEENFHQKHLKALSQIIERINWSEESEREILDFADKLYRKYV